MGDKRKFGGNLWSAERKILARAFELKAAQELQSLLREKIAVLPETSSDQIKPFQIGAHDLFRAMASSETSLADLKLALRRYTGATGYQMAIGLDESVRYRLTVQLMLLCQMTTENMRVPSLNGDLQRCVKATLWRKILRYESAPT